MTLCNVRLELFELLLMVTECADGNSEMLEQYDVYNIYSDSNNYKRNAEILIIK